MTRELALERYNELPLPSTTDEHWRFTDLRGFDPESYAGQRRRGRSRWRQHARDRRGRGRRRDRRRHRDRQRAGGHHVRAAATTTSASGRSSARSDKLTAHNAAVWQHGLLVHVPAGVELEKPLYVRVGNSTPGGSLFWRLLVVAEEGSRFTLIEESRLDSTRRSSPTRTRSPRSSSSDGAKLEYVSIQNLSRETWHFATHRARVAEDAELDWVAGRLRLAQGQDHDRERPRRQGRDLARHRRLLRRRRPAPRLRHAPGARGAEHDLRLRVQGRAARQGHRRSGAG